MQTEQSNTAKLRKRQHSNTHTERDGHCVCYKYSFNYVLSSLSPHTYIYTYTANTLLNSQMESAQQHNAYMSTLKANELHTRDERVTLVKR